MNFAIGKGECSRLFYTVYILGCKELLLNMLININIMFTVFVCRIKNAPFDKWKLYRFVPLSVLVIYQCFEEFLPDYTAPLLRT
jgi:hypothetical protein